MDRPYSPVRTVLAAASLTCRRRSCISHCGVIPVACWCKRRTIGGSLPPPPSECFFGAAEPSMDVVAKVKNCILPSNWRMRRSHRWYVICQVAMPATFVDDMDGPAEYSDAIGRSPWMSLCTGKIWWFGCIKLDPATARAVRAGRRMPLIGNPGPYRGYQPGSCWRRWVAPGSSNTVGASCSPSPSRSWACSRDHRGDHAVAQ